MSDLDDFRAFYVLEHRLIDGASKEDVVEAARLLALTSPTTRRSTERFRSRTLPACSELTTLTPNSR